MTPAPLWEQAVRAVLANLPPHDPPRELWGEGGVVRKGGGGR